MRARSLRSIVAAVTLSCAPLKPARVESPPPEQKSVAKAEPEQTPEPVAVPEETTVEGATERITAARENADGAVADLKRAQIEESDVAAARSALDGLKAAIEAGSKLEAKDLKYAKFALEARRVLRTHKEAVEKRWTDVLVETGRADIERTLAELKGATDRLTSKDAAEEDFKIARASADEVKQAIDRAQPAASKSSKFGTWVASVKTKLATQRRSIDDREVKLTADRQRAVVEESKKAIAAAIARLKGKDATDEQFEEAKSAVAVLTKTLDDSAVISAKDSTFARYIADVRRTIDPTKKQIEERRLGVQVERQRALVEESRRSIADALAQLSGKDVAEEKFAEAEATIAQAEKVLAAGESLAVKDRAYGTYAIEVKKRFQEARAKVGTRRVEVAIHQQRMDLTQAIAEMKKSLARLSSAPDVSETEASVGLVEKTIAAGEPLVAKDAIYAGFANEAKKSTVDARARIQARRDDIAMDAQKTKVESELENVKSAVAMLDGLTKLEPTFEAAVGATKSAKQAIDSGAELEKKLPKYATWAAQAKKKLEDATKRIEKRKLEVTVLERRSLIEETLGIAKGGVETVRQEDSTGKDTKDAIEKVRAVREAVAKGASLEAVDARYASFVAATKKQIDKLQAELDEGKHAVAFREGPAKALSDGLAAAESVSDSMGLEQRKSGHSKALELFVSCEKSGTRMIEAHPSLGTPKTKNVVAACSENAKTSEAKLTSVKAILAFYDGPAKSFEKAKKLSDSGKANEALGHFESCLEKGRLLQYKHPELGKQQFDVAGGKTTLPAVVAQCDKEAKAIRRGEQHAKK